MKKLLFALSILVIAIAACDDDTDYNYNNDVLTYEEQLAIDIEKIQKCIADSNFTAQSTESGLYYIIDEEGEGNYPSVDSIVKVKYVGKLLNGNVFGQGTIEEELSFFIYGWQEGIQKFKEGGSGKLLIPSSLGYGAYSVGSIPSYSVLMFDIELIDVSSNE